MNRAMAQWAPAVGTQATICFWSDREVAEVIKSTKSTITLRVMKSTLLNGPNSGEPDALTFTAGGFCGHWEGQQRWKLESDEDGQVYKATLRKDGHWRVANSDAKVLLGVARKFYDFNF